jgi:hypothetical protein
MEPKKHTAISVLLHAGCCYFTMETGTTTGCCCWRQAAATMSLDIVSTCSPNVVILVLYWCLDGN